MKKFALALAAAAAVMLGSAGMVDAYPPGAPNPPVPSDAAPSANATFTITVECTVGEVVTFRFPGSTIAALVDCVAGGGNALVLNGTATATLTAPSEPGTYTGSATGSISGDLGSFSIAVEAADPVAPTPDGSETGTPGGSLPATGSDGIGSTTMMAGGLLVVGLGMFGVASVRRRQTIAA